MNAYFSSVTIFFLVILSVMLGSAYKSEAHKFNGLLNQFSDSVYGISKHTSNMTMLPANLYKKFKFPAWSGFEEAMTQSLAYGEKMVNEIYSLEDIGDGLASRMIAEGMDKEMVTRILIDFIIAAGDTTTYTTQWALYLLSKNPKIIKEFQSAEESSEEQIYLKGIIKETMRLYPAAAFLTRLLPADSIVANYNLPAGTLIVMSLYTTGREEKYYPDPLKFDPQRWMKQNNEYNGVITPHASIPFAIGARSCIGRKIAMVQLNKTISKILRNFNLQTLHKHDVDDVMQMILKPKESLRILVTQR